MKSFLLAFIPIFVAVDALGTLPIFIFYLVHILGKTGIKPRLSLSSWQYCGDVNKARTISDNEKVRGF